MTSGIVRFGEFTIDAASGDLHHQATPVKLQPTASRILLLLINRAGHLVTRHEIRAAIWGEQRLGDFDLTLNTYIRQVRAALADTSKAPQFIATVPKRGYRFIGLRNESVQVESLQPDSAFVRSGGKQPLRDRHERERNLIIEAEKLFASLGFAETTTAQIARAAACAEGLIHKYFGGKQGLLLEITRRAASREIVDLYKKSMKATLGEEIVQMMCFEIDHIAQRTELLKILLRQSLVDRRFAQQMLDNGPHYRAAAIMQRLRKYEAGGQTTNELISTLAHAIIALAFVFGFLGPVFGEDREAQKRAALSIAAILASGASKSSFDDA